VSSELERVVQSFCPELIGISIRNIDNVNMMRPRSYVPDILNVAECVKRLIHVPVVVGGSGASLAPSRILQATGADYIVVSDGETAFVKLLDCLRDGASPAHVPGVGMIVDGRFHLCRPRLGDFSCGGVDMGRWIDMRPYQKICSGYPIQSKRGCTRRCIHCTYKLQVFEGNKVRLRRPEDVVDELEEALLKFRPQSFEFVDSLLNDPVDHLIEILEEIIRRPWKACFSAIGVCPKGLDKTLLDLMWKAGFRSFWVTPESASDTMLGNYCKGFTTDDVVRAAEALRKTRFSVAWTFLIGGPGETNATLQETLDFHMKHLRNGRRPPWYVAQYCLGVRIYPGTRLWDIAEAEGFVTRDSDPLEQLWYLSEHLDLKKAMRQLLNTSLASPELISGFDEMYLEFSRVWALMERVMRIPKLHWRLIYRGNQLLRKPVLWFGFKPDKAAADLRKHLEHGGY
jgi:radical SAM superfamily enzyme YgiQ (UPF0313 family)